MHDSNKKMSPRIKGRVTRKMGDFSGKSISLSHNKKETEDHDILHLYGSLGDNEQTNRNFDDIREEAEAEYMKWKQSEGKW